MTGFHLVAGVEILTGFETGSSSRTVSVRQSASCGPGAPAWISSPSLSAGRRCHLAAFWGPGRFWTSSPSVAREGFAAGAVISAAVLLVAVGLAFALSPRASPPS